MGWHWASWGSRTRSPAWLSTITAYRDFPATSSPSLMQGWVPFSCPCARRPSPPTLLWAHASACTSSSAEKHFLQVPITYFANKHFWILAQNITTEFEAVKASQRLLWFFTASEETVHIYVLIQTEQKLTKEKNKKRRGNVLDLLNMCL